MATIAAGNMSAVCGTSGTCITYDASGRVAETNAAGTFTEILYGPMGKLATLSGSTVLNAYIPMPGSGSVRQTPTTRSYQHADWLGTARLESGLASRNLTYDRAFAPFGEAYSTVIGGTSNQEYAGLRQDIAAGNGLFDTPNREYPATQGRWISVDPAGPGAVSPASPQTWNRYAYVLNGPLNAVDPSGLHEINDAVSYSADNGCYLTFSCTVYSDTYGMEIDPEVAQLELHNGSGVNCPTCQFGSSVDAANQMGLEEPAGRCCTRMRISPVLTGGKPGDDTRRNKAGRLLGSYWHSRRLHVLVRGRRRKRVQ